MLSYEHCELCPRRCGVNRAAGEAGFCRMPAVPRLARAAIHRWEEPILCGQQGAGAVFFSGCTLGCGFCQNDEISRLGRGWDAPDLRRIFLHLIEQGAATLDLVTPTHFLPHILPALTPKLPVPVVYNCGGYERVETLRELEGLVDVYLPDLKFSDGAIAAALAAAPDYPEVAKAAIREMFRQVGPPVMEDGILKRGVLIRHLILPGHLDNTLAALDWIAGTFRPGDVLVSLMSQYVPAGRLAKTPPFDRPITADEAAAARSWLELCGIRAGFVQERTSADSGFVPAFDGTGIKIETNV